MITLTELGYRFTENHRGLTELEPSGIIYSPWFAEMTDHLTGPEVDNLITELVNIASYSPFMNTNLGIFPDPSTKDPNPLTVAVSSTTGRLFYLTQLAGGLGLKLPKSLFNEDLAAYLAAKSTGSNRTGKHVNFSATRYIEGFSKEWTEDCLVPVYMQGIGVARCFRLNGDETYWRVIPGRIPAISLPIKRITAPRGQIDLTRYDNQYPLATGPNQLHANLFITPVPTTFKDLGLLTYRDHSLLSPRERITNAWEALRTQLIGLPIYQFDDRKEMLSSHVEQSSLLEFTSMIVKSWVEQVFLDLQMLCWHFIPTMRHCQNTTPAGMTDFEGWTFSSNISATAYKIRLQKCMFEEAGGVNNFLFEMRKVMSENQRSVLADDLGSYISNSILPENNKNHWLNVIESGLKYGAII